jgi:hypothetical protein
MRTGWGLDTSGDDFGGTRKRVVGFEKNEITDWVAASWPCSNQSLVGCDRECIMYTIQPPYIRGIASSLHTPVHPIQNHISAGKIAGSQNAIPQRG